MPQAAPSATPLAHSDLAGQPLSELRQAIRAGRYSGQTAGLAPGHLQGNVVILPQRYAFDFLRYCQRNPKPCPLLAVSDPGDPSLPALGETIDIRHDVPRYNVYRYGELADSVSDIGPLWQDNWVSFILGCSFSFEAALCDAGITLRHIEQGRNIAMYRSTLATRPCGAFRGGMVVSMRPLTAQDAITAVAVSARFPHAHGAPLHLGDPALIGIGDLARPDWGDPVTIHDDELPVFWACGVTPQEAIRQARPELCITHAPGSMLISDLPGDRAPGL